MTDHAPPTAPLDVAPQQLQAWLREGRPLTLVDCREPWEHAIVALPGATLLPLGSLAARAGELPRDKPVVVYCHHGVRSRRAALVLRSLGFEGAASLEGGIDLWAEELDPALPRY